MSCFVGFDGFIDAIIDPVCKRNQEGYTPFPSMQAFSETISKASEKSLNIELVVREEKIGGNGPNLARALVEFGHPVTLAGTFGKREIYPIFNPLVKKSLHTYSYEDPGKTDALEFSDGKIILGKLRPLQNLSYLDVVEKIGEENFFEILEKSTLFVSANWTMLPMTNALWDYIAKKIAPRLSKQIRYMFVDLADPAKREPSDLLEAMHLLRDLNQTFRVILSLNQAEALQVGKIFEIKRATAKDLFEKLHLFGIVVHDSKKTSAIIETDFAEQTPFPVSKVKIKTGAGDNFNAGFCHGLLQNLPLKKTLILANATASFYIQNGRSPSVEELAIFLQACDNIEV